MFIIRVNNQKYIWNNDRSDDFLQFLPKLFKVNKSAIEAFYVDPEDEAQVTPATIDSLDPSQVGTPLKAWPYDENGNFTGNKLEGDA